MSALVLALVVLRSVVPAVGCVATGQSGCSVAGDCCDEGATCGGAGGDTCCFGIGSICHTPLGCCQTGATCGMGLCCLLIGQSGCSATTDCCDGICGGTGGDTCCAPTGGHCNGPGDCCQTGEDCSLPEHHCCVPTGQSGCSDVNDCCDSLTATCGGTGGDTCCIPSGARRCNGPGDCCEAGSTCSSDGTCVAPTPTNTPTSTPTATPTNTPTATPTNTPVPQGGACATTSQCATGLSCADSVCCNTACTDPLMRCNLPGQLGTCASPAAEAPTLTPWGLLVTGILLTGIAAFALRHRMRGR